MKKKFKISIENLLIILICVAIAVKDSIKQSVKEGHMSRSWNAIMILIIIILCIICVGYAVYLGRKSSK